MHIHKYIHTYIYIQYTIFGESCQTLVKYMYSRNWNISKFKIISYNESNQPKETKTENFTVCWRFYILS